MGSFWGFVCRQPPPASPFSKPPTKEWLPCGLWSLLRLFPGNLAKSLFESRVSQLNHFHFLSLDTYDWSPQIQESPHPRARKSPKSLKKDFPGLPAWSVKKVSKKSLCSLFDSFSGHLGLFRHFFDTLGREAREVLFETFWGFRGSGVWRLLYMGIAIVSL